MVITVAEVGPLGLLFLIFLLAAGWGMIGYFVGCSNCFKNKNSQSADDSCGRQKTEA